MYIYIYIYLSIYLSICMYILISRQGFGVQTISSMAASARSTSTSPVRVSRNDTLICERWS